MSFSPPDHAARVAALDPTTSFCVQAPAGSGKTELLIQRYLRLLATVQRPEEIVAITFTRKAAAEMAARVTDALTAAAKDGPVAPGDHDRRTRDLAAAALARDRERGWGLLHNPRRMRIDTIDAFGLELVHRLPLLARLPTSVTPTEEAAPLYREAARRTLAELGGEHGAPVAQLLLHLEGRPEEFVGRLAELLAWRDQAAEVFAAPHSEAARARLEATLERVVALRLEELRQTVAAAVAGEIVACGRYAAANLADGDSPIVALADLTSLPAASGAALATWRGVADLLLTGDGTVRKAGGINVKVGFPPGKRGSPEAAAKARMQGLVAALADSPAWGARLAACRLLPEPAYDGGQWAVVGAVVEVVRLAAAHLWWLFRDLGVVDFPTIAMEAIGALGAVEAPDDLLLAIDAQVRHLLVDEFQDTSRRQLELLARLTAGWEEGDGRTLFVVGDPMQSIYRFRQAEVALFLRARRHGVGTVRLTPLTLTANFRSDPAVVGWVNNHLGPLFPEQEDEVAGAVAYCPSTAVRAAAGGEVRLLPLLAHPGEAVAAERSEAARVVALVAAARERGEGCAILVRARSHLVAILLALHRAGRPYQAREVLPLGERPVVLDLVALTRALLSPWDRTAWLAALHAPFCGLDPSALLRLVEGAEEVTIPSLLAQEERLALLAPEAATRAARLAAVLAQAEGEVGRRPLAQRVEGAWVALGGPATVGPGELAAARAYLRLVRALEAEGPVSVAEVERRLARLFAPPDPAADGTLAVMTIHKAKGLEFDTVIVPGLGRPPRPSDYPLLRWLHLPEGPLLAARPRGDRPDPIYDYVGMLEREQEAQEERRLLYVAATRARRRLYLLGTVEARADGAVRPPGRSLLDLLWPQIAEQALAQVEEVEGDRPEEGGTATVWRLAATFRIPAPAPSLTPAVAVRSAAGEGAPFRWAGEAARHMGTVVHAALAHLAEVGGEGWDAARVATLGPALRAALAAAGVAGTELEAAAARAAAAVAATVADPRGRWLLGRHEAAASEVALAGELGGQIVHCRFDRTFVAGGVRWIVDYKVATHEGGDRDAFLAVEWQRYLPQLARYATLMARLDDRPIRIALYHPLLGGWQEAGWPDGVRSLLHTPPWPI